jgi:hypothetical protein
VNATRLLRIQTENKRLLYAEELQNAISASIAKKETAETEGLLSSLQTMSLGELLATQALAKEEYGFGALLDAPDDENSDY